MSDKQNDTEAEKATKPAAKAEKATKPATKPATTQTTRQGNVVVTKLPKGLTIRNAVGTK